VLQVSIYGEVHRLVVSVNEVSVLSVASPLLGPPYQEGWHPNMNLDYPNDLDVHSQEFKSVSMDETVNFICQPLQIGSSVSVYAYCSGEYLGSAHQIHRNDHYPDGAIVINPQAQLPTYLLFRYSDQVF